MGGRSSMQGTSWHYINRWELKPKDEFEWETKEKESKKKKRKKKVLLLMLRQVLILENKLGSQ